YAVGLGGARDVRYARGLGYAGSFSDARRFRRAHDLGAVARVLVLDGGRKLDGEARAHRLIVLHANLPAGLGHDVADNREAQSAAAILGGEVRQEELLLIVRADAAARVGDDELDRLGRARLGRDVE